jgi:hypothetical protein
MEKNRESLTLEAFNRTLGMQCCSRTSKHGFKLALASITSYSWKQTQQNT